MFFRKLACSFCSRDESQVSKLVAGPHVYICDRCAYETIRIMETTPPAGPSPVAPRAPWSWRRWLGPSRQSRPIELEIAG